MLGNAGREVLRAEQGRMERADAGDTAAIAAIKQAVSVPVLALSLIHL